VSSRFPSKSVMRSDLDANLCAEGEEASRVSARIANSESTSRRALIRAPPCLPVAPETSTVRDMIYRKQRLWGVFQLLWQGRPIYKKKILKGSHRIGRTYLLIGVRVDALLLSEFLIGNHDAFYGVVWITQFCRLHHRCSIGIIHKDGSYKECGLLVEFALSLRLRIFNLVLSIQGPRTDVRKRSCQLRSPRVEL
jgi:hypothetical protein